LSHTITLLRHAKSSRENMRLDDIDRPLAERGRKDAPRMAAWMKTTHIKPDLVLCSTSRRTRETLALIGAAIPPNTETRFEASLYHAEAAVLLRAIQGVPELVRHVLLIGHNPGFHDLALQLASGGDRAMRALLAEKFSTCGCAVFSVQADRWADLEPKRCCLTQWMAPKRLA
jgi:phosphohistidine phosphatase